MNIHTRIVGALHIFCGLLVIVCVALFMLFFGVFVSWVPNEQGVLSFFGALGLVVAIPLILMGLAEIIAAIAMLRGSRTGHIFTIVFGILHLVNFPIGSAIGIYTLWALLRNESNIPLEAERAA
ncbi:MAG: hypothetical protein V4857_29630 [Pseudomonadota bacterium]